MAHLRRLGGEDAQGILEVIVFCLSTDTHSQTHIHRHRHTFTDPEFCVSSSLCLCLGVYVRACVCERVSVLSQGLFYWAIDRVADQESNFWFGKVAIWRRKYMK